MDLERLEIRKLIVHEIPRQKGDRVEPVLSDALSPLDGDSGLFFEVRTMDSIKTHGFAVNCAAGDETVVPQLIRRLLTDDANLVEESQVLANRLVDAQTGVPPEGLMVVATGRHGPNPAVVIAKLEKERGVRVTTSTRGGKTFLEVRFIPDLMLSEKTNLFKSGVFSMNNGTVEGMVADQQTTGTAKNVVARFFLQGFLECTLAIEPRIATKRFFESAHSFIRAADLRPEKKGDFVFALQSALKAERSTLTPASFARDNLPTDLRREFLKHLKSEGAPDTVFQKELSMVEKRLLKTHYSFESGIALSAPSDVMKERVKVRTRSNGSVGVSFEDRINKVS